MKKLSGTIHKRIWYFLVFSHSTVRKPGLNVKNAFNDLPKIGCVYENELCSNFTN
ncbi:hypothetical protein EDD53_0992 [Pacificibacter maritimus]|uniref:Uncharacterized protein n=1 Tax=Pacificibacter maritimus TaxID=762213 RepID=A0A3N4UMP1_9RHOB|nr:hypothetical protein EDD53_0992 [Pacificibacter maritimus]